MRALIKKNLVAHKNTNKLTSVIYALTLGCVIFLCVALNLVLKSTESFTGSDNSYATLKEADIALFSLTAHGFYMTTPVDNVLRKYSPDIKDFGLITKNLQTAMAVNIGYGMGLTSSDLTQSVYILI